MRQSLLRRQHPLNRIVTFGPRGGSCRRRSGLAHPPPSGGCRRRLYVHRQPYLSRQLFLFRRSVRFLRLRPPACGSWPAGPPARSAGGSAPDVAGRRPHTAPRRGLRPVAANPPPTSRSGVPPRPLAAAVGLRRLRRSPAHKPSPFKSRPGQGSASGRGLRPAKTPLSPSLRASHARVPALRHARQGILALCLRCSGPVLRLAMPGSVFSGFGQRAGSLVRACGPTCRQPPAGGCCRPPPAGKRWRLRSRSAAGGRPSILSGLRAFTGPHSRPPYPLCGGLLFVPCGPPQAGSRRVFLP